MAAGFGVKLIHPPFTLNMFGSSGLQSTGVPLPTKIGGVVISKSEGDGCFDDDVPPFSVRIREFSSFAGPVFVCFSRESEDAVVSGVWA